jgi:hypothetical protein
VLPGFAAVLVMVAVGGDALPGSWLQMSAPDPGCPGATEVASAVERELGRAPSAVEVGALPPVRCELARDGRAWRADIEIQRTSDEPGAVRRIRVPGRECRRLLPALVLTLTLALAAPTPAEPAPPPSPVTQARDPEVPPALVARAAPGDPPARWNFSAAAVVTSGALPELAGGLSLGGRRRSGPFALGVEARSDRGRAGQRGTVAVSGWRASSALLPCVAPGSVSACLVTRLGLLRLHGEGSRSSRSVQGVLAEAGARVAWQSALAGQPLELHAEVALPMVRTRLLADGLSVWRAPAAVFGLGIAVLTSR